MIAKQILAYHYAKITGVRIVKEFAPRIISKAELPMIVLFADDLEAIERTGTSTTKYRTIRAVLFVDIVGMSTEASPYEKTDPFFDEVDTYFEARQTLALDNGTTVLMHEYMGDEGETVTPYPTGDKVSQFWTITFRHRFTIVKPVIFQSGE